MTRMYPCRKVKRLSILAAVFFAAGALIPVNSASGVFGADEARAVGILQALVKSSLVQAAAGGGKTGDHSGSDADTDPAPVSAATEKSAAQDLDPEDPQIDRTGL
jgi:hypothetical protein